MHARTATRRSTHRGSVGVAVVIFAALIIGPGVGTSSAVVVPPAGGFYIQSSGPNAGPGIGDWYSSTPAGAGNGYNYLLITVPCGWPPATPLYVDLFSPEINAAGAAVSSDEPRGAGSDSTQFELYGPGASVGPGYNLPAPGAGIVQTTYTPQPAPESWLRFATLSPVACGSYVLRSAVIGAGDDDNGWRVRVGTDNDGDPNNALPANSDDFDGLPGTNDEIVVGQVQITYQHSLGGVACLTLFEFVAPSQPSVTFNNFDMDGNTRVRYYAPSAVLDPTGQTGGTVGTLSTNAMWNGGVGLARGGDTIANPESGWWRIVSCLSSVNQFIQEGQNVVGAYYSEPPTPALAIGKDDGITVAPAGGALTYTVTVTNTSSGAGAGAALAVVITDTIPVNSTYQSCAIVAPATGTCTQSLGVVTATLNNWINAGSSAAIRVTVTVNAGATGTISNDVRARYKDALGNPFAEVTASDVDTAGPPVTVPDTAIDTIGDGRTAPLIGGAILGILLMGLLGLGLVERRRRLR